MKPVASAPAVDVVPVRGRQGLRDWLEVPRRVFADDPAWIEVPEFFERRRVSPRHAPFFSYGEAELFVAHRDGRPVGRISAQVNLRHLEVHRDETGHFGFFDCLDDPEAARQLVDTAAGWLRGRGQSRMVGPVSFSLNEEAGCLIEGFDSSPAVLMPHDRPWTGGLLEQAGLAKEIDLLAARNPSIELPPAAARIARRAAANPRVASRPIQMKRFRQDIRLMFDIAADAWADNWGFVPFAEAEVNAAITELRPILKPDLGQFLMLDGEEVGFMLVLPNLNDIFASMKPGWPTILDPLRVYAGLLRNAPRTFRVPLLGIRRAARASPHGGALMAVLCRELGNLGARYRPEWTEMSWILETNRAMLRVADMFGQPVKRYRLYSKAL